MERLDLHWYNARMRKMWIIAFGLFILIGLFLSGCVTEAPMESMTLTGTLDGTLRPYPTDTATATPLPTGYSSPTPSPTVTPTATQVFYEVQAEDDMYSIAWRYNLSPGAIMTANPTVNPRAMSVGMTLLIPVTPMPEGTPTQTEELSPRPTPSFARLYEPDCYHDALGGLWCFILVENDETGALENVSAVVVLQAGEETRQEIAIMPLNLLPAGESLPLIAYFQAVVPADFDVSAQVDFLLPVMPDDQRYLTAEIRDQEVALSENGKVAAVTGELSLPEGQPDTRYLWINATAFDGEGHVVAVRRWDSHDQLSAGESASFNLFLYSMGGRIDRVNLLVEARPIQEPLDE